MSNWTENDHPTPEQERVEDAKRTCRERGVDPDALVPNDDYGRTEWMVAYDEMFEHLRWGPAGPYG